MTEGFGEGTWVTIILAVVAYAVQGVGFLYRRALDLENIKQEISEKISAERLARTKALNSAVTDRDAQVEKIRHEWNENQRAQDNTVGEMGLALRRAIESVEKEMHSIEIWNRDNYVRKQELDSVRSDIKELAAEMRTLVGGVQVNMQQDFKEAIRDLKGQFAKT